MITCPTDRLQKVLLGGGCEQNGTPTPDNPIDIVCNNGVLKARHQSGLPLGYTLLDYITSSGTQYIDTGIIPNVTTRVVAKIAFAEVSSTHLCWGSRSSGTYSTSLDQFYCGCSSANLWYYSATKQTIIRSGISTDVFYDIDVVNTLVTETATQSIYLFALNNLGTASTGSSLKIAKFEIYNNSVLVRNFIPAKRNSDNVVGMYDLVSGQLLTNAGTGDFVAGIAVSDPVEIYTDGTVETIEDNLGNTATAEMLLKVGQYKDEQSILDGVVTRNVGIKVLDGTENWNSSITSRFYLIDNVMKAQDNSPTLCSHYKSVKVASTTAVGNRQIALFVGDGARLVVGDDNYTTINGFKQFLADQYNAGTPVIVIYPLATPTTEQATPQPLAGNTVTQTAGSIDNLPIESSTIAELKKRYIGDKEVKRVYIGDNLVWENN